jgi:2-desacetyl-2-hydroxyethyl bacteriochlorophyllide A dehydrogenase
MKAIVLEKPGSFAAGERPDPAKPASGEALVRIRRVGICGTDYHAFRGKQPFFLYPRVLGHELGVEVVEVGAAVKSVKVGDRASVEPYFNCGTCIACRNGKSNCCANLKVLGVHIDGGMCEELLIPADKLHTSKKLSLDQLALVETLGIGAHAASRANLRKGEFALIIGAGPIGLSVVPFAQATGAKVIVTDINERRLAFCREQFGVEHTAVAGENLKADLEKIAGGDLPMAVFDVTGNPQSMMRAFDLLAPGGRLVFVGLFQGDVTFNDPNFHRREMTLLASRNSTSADFRHIIGLMESGKLDTTPWITHRAPRDEMPAQFDSWLKPESNVIKAVVEF